MKNFLLMTMAWITIIGCGSVPMVTTSNSHNDTRLSSSAIVPSEPHNWAEDVLYFVIIDRFADGDKNNNYKVNRSNPGAWHGGDFIGLREKLPRLQQLGITSLWITPIVQQIQHPMWANGEAGTGWEQGFEHYAYHGYWAEDFGAIETHLGDMDEFKALVDAAHKKGIKVILDVVYNHPGYGSRYLESMQYKNWIRKETGSCDDDPTTCQLFGLPDFNTDNANTRQYLIDSAVKLAKNTNIDGFRLDTVKHIDQGFWQEHRDRVRTELGDDFFLLGEIWGADAKSLRPWFENDLLDSAFDFSFSGNCRGFSNGKGRPVAFAKYLESRHSVNKNHHLVHYLSSHDETGALHELKGDKDKFKLCVALQMTSNGIPMIFYGEEVGRDIGAFPNNRGPMPWGDDNTMPGAGIQRDDVMEKYYQSLISYRRSHPELSVGDFTLLEHGSDHLIFKKSANRNGIVGSSIVMINRGQNEKTVQIDNVNLDTSSHWNIDKTKAVHSGEYLQVRLRPMSVSILSHKNRG